MRGKAGFEGFVPKEFLGPNEGEAVIGRKPEAGRQFRRVRGVLAFDADERAVDKLGAWQLVPFRHGCLSTALQPDDRRPNQPPAEEPTFAIGGKIERGSRR